MNNLNHIPDSLKKYINQLEFAHTEALKLGHDVAGKVFRDGMYVVDKLDDAIDGKRWDEVKELEAELDAICDSKLKRVAMQVVLKHFASLHDALCVLEDLTLDERGNHPAQVDRISTSAHDLESVLMEYQYHLSRTDADNNDDVLLEE